MSYYLGLILLTLSISAKAVVIGPIGHIKAYVKTDDGRRHVVGHAYRKNISLDETLEWIVLYQKGDIQYPPISPSLGVTNGESKLSPSGVYWTLSKEDEVEFNHPMEYFSYIKEKYKIHADQIQNLVVARAKITSIDELLYRSLNPSFQDPISLKTNRPNIDYFQKINNESGDTWGYVFPAEEAKQNQYYLQRQFITILPEGYHFKKFKPRYLSKLDLTSKPNQDVSFEDFLEAVIDRSDSERVDIWDGVYQYIDNPTETWLGL